MISATSSFTYFALLTLAYFVLRYLMVDKYENKGNSALGIALIIVYLGIMFLIQFMVNMSNAKERCGGTPQILTALTYTAIPNILIFGLLIMMIMFFPGWKAPFSNTLGYLIVSSPIFRARDVFNNILVKKSSNKLLNMVYRDPSLMINEMTPANFDIFISKMGEAKNPILVPNFRDYLPKLYNLVLMKDRISEFMWYLLTGALVISNSNSYIQTFKCKRTSGELASKLDKALMANSKKEKKKQKWKLAY